MPKRTKAIPSLDSMFDEVCSFFGLSHEERTALPRSEDGILKLGEIAILLASIFDEDECPENKPSRVIETLGPGPTVKQMLIAGDVDSALQVMHELLNFYPAEPDDLAPRSENAALIPRG